MTLKNTLLLSKIYTVETYVTNIGLRNRLKTLNTVVSTLNISIRNFPYRHSSKIHPNLKVAEIATNV